MGAMKAYDLFAISIADLEQARISVERALGICLQAHDSDYRGGLYYRAFDVGRENFILQKNFNALHEEYTEPEYKDVALLLYVDETTRSHEISDILAEVPSFRLVRHEVLNHHGSSKA